ncbi:hypothetical protein FHU10_5230 [Serratia fonticola]|uniref:Uncharacterized protein n=1 Tax=Serratia fonticola TaxID=47917 RepID=A0A559TD51_SERFO|nr:hypothetical protein FHU09_2474 [Serratia fonticola]TQI98054.1 hypothetical protein FHU11_3573 [Serratia fonticola]TVZ72548.1 hypothetical protein FHU10_5230 [Serratia fonticola]
MTKGVIMNGYPAKQLSGQQGSFHSVAGLPRCRIADTCQPNVDCV